MQLAGAGASTNPLAMAQKIVAEDGVGMLYRGLSAGILRQLTYANAQKCS